nr:MAG TPA: major capsid protein [Microviridae sp.]
MRNMDSRFAINPQVNISRSKFNRDCSVKTSFNVGQLIPFYFDEVLPGDTFQMRTSLVCRMQPLVTAPMDNVYLDFYYFFVPNRLVWDHWRELNGENTESAWIPKTEYQVPQITAPTGGWQIGTIADYFGIPTGVSGLSISALPFRAYSLIVNEWFRDQNLKDPLETPKDDATVVGVNTGNYITDCAKGGLPFVAAKLHDYFTSCLPAPQKGPDVMITGGTSIVTTKPEIHSNAGSKAPLTFGTVEGSINNTRSHPFLLQPSSETNPILTSIAGDVSSSVGGNTATLFPNNLYVSNEGSTSINQLRVAFQIQKMYEKDARGGTRYQEMIKSHFGVTSPDARLQRPEYLGGERLPININQVIQNSATTDVSPQGNVAGYSVTSDSHGDFIRSFTEHGMIIGLCVARYEHTYQQGLSKFWSKKSRTDFYLPVLANIGEQPVLNKEIYAQGTAVDDEVFGYQEAWADYRYKPSIVTGEMRSNHNKSLDSWHFADDYDALPHLSSDWINEDQKPVDRALAVQSTVSNQLFADFFIQNETTRPMPVYSIPGLIDHH